MEQKLNKWRRSERVREMTLPGVQININRMVSINRLSILCTLEDESISIDDLSEKSTEMKDFSLFCTKFVENGIIIW